MKGSTVPVGGIVSGIASRLRFPYLLLFTGGLFVLDLLIPDLIPFVDEILLGLGTLVLATWRKRVEVREASADDGPVVDVSPGE